VTSQAICEAAYFFFRLIHMAIKTPAHIHFHGLSGHIHLTNIAVTSFTVKTCTEMRLVVEINKIRLKINPHPRDWLSTFIVAGNLLYLWVICINYIVTSHAFLHGWDAGYLRLLGARMAKQTLDTRRNMNLVAVRDRLLGGCVNLVPRENYSRDYAD
jgi:hypothetical protein